jgi:hypothetical protein
MPGDLCTQLTIMLKNAKDKNKERKTKDEMCGYIERDLKRLGVVNSRRVALERGS